jgi:hypothetical protein
MRDGQPVKTTLEYSSGLGILIPQKYVLQLLDSAGIPKMAPLEEKKPN